MGLIRKFLVFGTAFALTLGVVGASPIAMFVGAMLVVLWILE